VVGRPDRLDGELGGRPVGEGTMKAPRRDGDDDGVRMGGAQCVGRAERSLGVGDHDIGAGEQTRRGSGEHGPLSVAQVLEHRRVRAERAVEGFGRAPTPP
jgi:hypothetical protein